MNNGSGWRSRKFVQAFVAELALLGALVVCLAEASLRSYLPYVIGGLVTVAIGYGAANAWEARSYSNNGNAPGMEP